jgi:hypothetical protein
MVLTHLLNATSEWFFVHCLEFIFTPLGMCSMQTFKKDLKIYACN